MSGYPSTSSGRWILLATVLASGAAFLLASAVNIALPSIQSSFGTDLSGLQWVVNAQLLTLAALLPVGGSLGDRFGRKRVFLTGIALFGIAGILSGLAGTVKQLIAFQAIQGIGSALMVPQSLATINVCFTEDKRGQVIGLWAGFSGAIGALGPWIGGWLVQNFSWSAIFFMTAFVSLAAFVITYIFIPESSNHRKRRLDWPGTLCIFAALLGIAYGLITGPTGWTRPTVLISLSGGLAAAVIFVLLETRMEEPLVPLQIFWNPLVSGANMVTLLLYLAINGVMFFCVLNLQQIQGYSPANTGLALLPPIILITFLSGPAGSLADRIGPRLQMILGPMVVALGAGLLTTGGADTLYLRDFLPGLTLVGIGMALAIAPLTKSALSVAPELSGAASGVNNAVARIAALLAIAILGAIMVSTFTPRLSETLTASGLSVKEQQQVLVQADRLAGIKIPGTFDEEAQASARRVIAESFIYGFRWTMAVAAALAFCGGIVSFLTIRNKVAK